MKKITEITRRDIYDLFKDGYDEPYNFLESNSKVNYYYYGRLTEIEFLKKLYNLRELPSDDSRFSNAEEDIWQHTVNNDDYPLAWVFEDDRFGLLNGTDEVLLKFLCAVFHPENRQEKGYWKEYLTKINSYINADGYELYESENISNRYVYSWRAISIVESQSGEFAPFSRRHKKVIENKSLSLPTIPKKARREIVDIFDRYDESINAVVHFPKNRTAYN